MTGAVRAGAHRAANSGPVTWASTWSQPPASRASAVAANAPHRNAANATDSGSRS